MNLPRPRKSRRRHSDEEVVTATHHLLELVDWYLRGGTKEVDSFAHELVENTVTESLRHFAAVRLTWIEILVARAVRRAAAAHPKGRRVPAEARTRWRKETELKLAESLSELCPTPAKIERVMKLYGKLMRDDTALGVQEALTDAVGTIFEISKSTAQRGIPSELLPIAIGSVSTDLRFRGVAPEWLNAERGFNGERHAELLERYTGEGMRLKQRLLPRAGVPGYRFSFLESVAIRAGESAKWNTRRRSPKKTTTKRAR